jgi:hypothetical protein
MVSLPVEAGAMLSSIVSPEIVAAQLTVVNFAVETSGIFGTFAVLVFSVLPLGLPPVWNIPLYNYLLSMHFPH